MANGPSPPGRMADLHEVRRTADGHHRVLSASVHDVRDGLATLAGRADPLTLRRIHADLDELAAIVERHLAMETHLLWPALASLAASVRQRQPRPPMPFPSLLNPVRLLEAEHARIEERVRTLRQAIATVAGLPGPGDGDLEAKLAALDSAVAGHVRFAREVVFRLALDIEGQSA